jgi:DNA-binding NarL/FixJ family response regulator
MQARDCFEQQTRPRGVRPLVRREFKVREESALLTTRELELVRYLAAGLRNKEIGERLHISEGTVKTHLHNIYEKVGVEGRVSLVVWAKERGLV